MCCTYGGKRGSVAYKPVAVGITDAVYNIVGSDHPFSMEVRGCNESSVTFGLTLTATLA